MLFVIFDDGNLVESFDDETEAVMALSELAAVPGADERLLLLACDESGEPSADWIPGERLVIPA